MATTYSAQLDIALTAARTDAGTLSTIVDQVATGASGFDAISKTLTTGTGSGQANLQFYEERTVNSGVDYDYDLTALTDRNGVALSFSKIKWCIIVIDVPTTGVKLIFKGSTATNPVALWKASATANEDIHDLLVRTNNIDGWTVTNAASDVLRLTASGGNVTYRIFLAGS